MKYSDISDTERFYGSEDEELGKYCADHRFSNDQLEIIRHGIESGIDVSIYANPDIPVDIMQQLFLSLKGGHAFFVRFVEKGKNQSIQLWSSNRTYKQEVLDDFNEKMNKESKFEVIDIRHHSEWQPV